MRLCHNMNAVKAYNAYNKNLTANRSASKKISTGLKINSAKDNAAKIGQLNQMNIQLTSMQSAERNVQDGASMLQVADGALQEVNNILSRLKELTVSANDGAKSSDDLKIIQDEIEQLKCNINDIARDTEFNGVKLLGADGVDNPYEKYITVGAIAGDRDLVKFYNTSCDSLGTSTLKISDIDFCDASKNKNNFINIVDGAIDTINQIRGEIGAKSNVYNNLVDISQENQQLISSASSRIGDADMAVEALEISRTELLVNAGIALIGQSNQLPLDCLQILQSARR
ncbi:MAG: flagellin [Clostridiales bacterium]|nr:flagellin [Clostridiales bacterium]